MHPRRSRIKLALVLVAFLTLAGLLWGPVEQARNVAAVQDSLKRGWEINFGSHDRPSRLPEWLDELLRPLFYKIEPSDMDRGSIYHERFHSAFRGPIEFIGIKYSMGFHGDELGAALARFSHLRRFAIIEDAEDVPTEADWTALCARLRSLTQLEQIELAGALLTDAAIAPLKGHPGLQRLNLSGSKVTPACLATLETVPHLSHLDLKYLSEPSGTFSQKDQDAMRAALPGVEIEFY
jgi:hypothetical protein